MQGSLIWSCCPVDSEHTVKNTLTWPARSRPSTSMQHKNRKSSYWKIIKYKTRYEWWAHALFIWTVNRASQLPVARQQVWRPPVGRLDTITLLSNGKPDVRTHNHIRSANTENWPVVKRCLMGLTAAAGEDCALPRGLWGNEDWNTPSCCKAWWDRDGGREEIESNDSLQEDESEISSFTAAMEDVCV